MFCRPSSSRQIIRPFQVISPDSISRSFCEPLYHQMLLFFIHYKFHHQVHSARRCFFLRVAVLDKVTDFLLFIGKLTIVMAIGKYFSFLFTIFHRRFRSRQCRQYLQGLLRIDADRRNYSLHRLIEFCTAELCVRIAQW